MILSKRTGTVFFGELSHPKLSIHILHYSKLSTQFFSKPNPTVEISNKFLVHCNSQITKHGRTGNITAAESIFNSILHKNVVSYTAMLTAYAENGQIAQARKLFDEMPERSTASYNAMITAYIRNNCMVDDAFRLFSRMGQRNSVSYAAMITGFLRAGMFDKAEGLYGKTPVGWRDPVCSNAMISGYLKAGRLEMAIHVFEGMVEKDIVSWSSMVDGYCKKGRVVEARRLFDRMAERNVVTWTAMIDGYMNVGCFEDGFGLFLSMRREGVVAVNPCTLTILFQACGHFGRCMEGMQTHSLVVHMGFGFDIFIGNSIITMYCRFGCMDEANRMFEMMSNKDVVSWNSLICGHMQDDQVEEAYKLFQKMPRKDVVSWTTMISGFSTTGNVEKSIELFKVMPEKDDVAWTAVISGFVNNGYYEEAFLWFIEMLKKAVRPNSLTFSSMLSGSAGLATLSLGLQILAHVVKMDMEFDLSIQNSLISMFSKCGNVVEAYQTFKNIDAPDVISFNSMITGFGQNGHGEEALQLFTEMQTESWKPNEITFLAVLSACTHAGLVAKGWEYFNLMKSVYDIEPGPDHYTCMVDLLGRAGLLDEAVNLIHSIPFEANSGIWGALLSASRIHVRLDLAETASEHLIKLEPDTATPYVILSDLYNIAGKKRDGDQVRMAKKSRGIKKSPGCSWIITQDKVHLFHAGDQCTWT